MVRQVLLLRHHRHPLRNRAGGKTFDVSKRIFKGEFWHLGGSEQAKSQLIFACPGIRRQGCALRIVPLGSFLFGLGHFPKLLAQNGTSLTKFHKTIGDVVTLRALQSLISPHENVVRLREQQLDSALARGGDLGLKLGVQGLDFLLRELFAQERLAKDEEEGIVLKIQGIAQEKSATRLGRSRRKHLRKEEISVGVFVHIGIIGGEDMDTPRGQLLREEVVQRGLRMEEQRHHI